jgi:protein-disulfide isomerase
MAILKTPINKNDHIRGPANAPVSLVEYGDYECPHCGLVYPTVKRVQSHFRRQLRFVFRHFPLSEVHPYAEIAAEGAEFAGAAGMFWDMHDALFESQSMLSVPTGAQKKSAQRLYERHTQRRQWHADFLHQRRAARWRL